MHGVHLDQVDNVSRALKPAETDLLWNFLVEVALNSDDTQRIAHEKICLKHLNARNLAIKLVVLLVDFGSNRVEVFVHHYLVLYVVESVIKAQ